MDRRKFVKLLSCFSALPLIPKAVKELKALQPSTFRTVLSNKANFENVEKSPVEKAWPTFSKYEKIKDLTPQYTPVTYGVEFQIDPKVWENELVYDWDRSFQEMLKEATKKVQDQLERNLFSSIGSMHNG